MFRSNPLLTSLCDLIDRERAREQEEREAQDSSRYQQEREAERAQQETLTHIALESAQKFMVLEERRVNALEQLAHAHRALAEALQLMRSSGLQVHLSR